VNPAHLFLGTIADNNADMAAKGRSLVGEKHHMRKLTSGQVLEIRVSNMKGVTLAAKYDVSTQLISRIKRREIWKHI